MSLRDLKTADERRAFLEKELAIDLSSLKDITIENASHVHCENLVGASSVPLGIAGPLLISGEFAQGEFYIPLATTEGALVASISRGCKAIKQAGGANVLVHKSGTTRGPVFYTGSLKKSNSVYKWLQENESTVAKAAEKTSSHLKFNKMDIRILGNYVFVRFYFNTHDAMGMNMATIAAEAAAAVIEQETGIDCISVAGNFDIDKKAAWINFIENRGIKVWSEVILSPEVLKTVLKTTPKDFFDVWLAKCMLGSAMSGSLGFNAHFANVIAALFIATGQDVAHVVEGSMGITTARVLEDGNLYISIYIPSLMLGTVGGGTSLPTQQEALKIVGVSGPGNVEKFAEVVGTAVLAGELSLLAALSEGALAKAHKKLGR